LIRNAIGTTLTQKFIKYSQLDRSYLW
jgi:hypothetical protein